MKDKWLIGIKFCGYLMIILPLRFLIDSILIFLFFSLPLTKFPQFVLNYYAIQPLSLLIQVAGIILGVGVLRLKKWSLKWVFVINWVGAAVGFISLFLPIKYPIGVKILLILVNVFYVWFFTRPKVEERFK